MQHHGDRPVRGVRPSLLSSEEPAAPERQGILSSLDGLKASAAPRHAAPVRARRWAWGAAAVGAVVVGAALFLFAQEEGEERRAPALAAAAPAEVPVAAAAPSAAAGAVAAVQAAPAELPASAAAAPAVPVPPPQPAVPPAGAAVAPVVPLPAGAVAPAALHASAPAVVRDVAPVPMPNPLADLAPSPRVGQGKPNTHGKDASGGADARRSAGSHARDGRAHDRHAAAKPAEDRQAAPKRKGHAQDNDVVLLMALMNHIDPKTRKATPAEQLETCKRYNAAGEEQCRIRVCEAVGRKERACRHVPAPSPAH